MIKNNSGYLNKIHLYYIERDIIPTELLFVVVSHIVFLMAQHIVFLMALNFDPILKEFPRYVRILALTLPLIRDDDPDSVGSVNFWAAGFDPLLFSTYPDPTCNM